MSTFALENEDLCQALRRRVKHYKREHPALSSQQIAKKFNMSSSTLNRIENQDIRNPTIDQVLKVLRGTGETNDLLGFIEEYYPDIADTYKRVYTQNADANFVNPELEKYFSDKKYFKILLLAFTGSGTSREEIVCLFGLEGESRLDELIKLNLLKVTGNNICQGEAEFKMSQQVSKSLLGLTVEAYYKPENMGNFSNYLVMITKEVNKKKTDELVIKVLEEARSKILNILNDPENKGSDKMFLGLTMDSLV
ncbi:MAG: helix-turn-helix domain-containing protein [Bacteriovoracaceae bacterium]|nr:helix-turn-helix domain-containing protein [Bacteriovoracaceae bacterium]